MTQHDVNVSLRQMLDHAREAVAMAKGRRREDLPALIVELERALGPV